MIQYDPTGIYEQNPAKGGVCQIKSAFDRALVARTGYTLVAAVTGKRIRVISYTYSQWNAAANGVKFFSNTTQIYPQISLTAVNSQEVQKENSCGWFETNTGEGLLIDTLLAGCDTQIRYIEYTP